MLWFKLGFSIWAFFYKTLLEAAREKFDCYSSKALSTEDRVRFVVPDNIDNSFNILVLHQNRTKRGSSENSYFHEKNIPKFIDFVLWGHEHDNRVSLEYSSTADCFISQPGSTVPTSLTEGESLPKSIGQLIVNQNRFTFTEIPLETPRQVLWSAVNLGDIRKYSRLLYIYVCYTVQYNLYN